MWQSISPCALPATRCLLVTEKYSHDQIALTTVSAAGATGEEREREKRGEKRKREGEKSDLQGEKESSFTPQPSAHVSTGVKVCRRVDFSSRAISQLFRSINQ